MCFLRAFCAHIPILGLLSALGPDKDADVAAMVVELIVSKFLHDIYHNINSL